MSHKAFSALLIKLHSILLIIFGIFSNLLGIKNPLCNKERKILKSKILDNFFYILIEDGKTKTITSEKPIMLEIFPTLKCNLCCRYCDRGKEDSMLEDFREIEILYYNLKKNHSFHLSKFRISGGEPLLYPKVNELIWFLRTIDPYTKVDFITNVIELKRLTRQSLALIRIKPSIYPYTEEILQKDSYAVSLFESLAIPLKANTLFHSDMNSYGSIRREFDPLFSCLAATLVCGTKQVYPCCRAHRLEQMYQKKYHLHIHASNLYKNLKNIIKDTDLCSHCPRIYSNCTKMPLKHSLAKTPILNY